MGFVRRAVGLRGEVEVEALTDDDDRFVAGLQLHAGARNLSVVGVRPTPRGLLLRFTGVDDRNAAERLRGEYLEIDAAAVPALPEGSYYHWQLIGLELFSPDGRPVGKLVDVQPYPANDVYVISAGGAELLVPAVRDVILEVDIERGRMVVDLPPEEEVR